MPFLDPTVLTGSARLATATIGEPGGDVVDRERGLRAVAGDPDLGPVAGTMPPFASTVVLPPVVEETLAVFECRFRGGIVLPLALALELVPAIEGSCSGCTRVVVSSRRSSSIKKTVAWDALEE